MWTLVKQKKEERKHNMKDRRNPCIYYICANETCQKGRKNVTMDKCKNCSKYRGRKVAKKPLPVRLKREQSKYKADRRDFKW